jgi:4-hydroxy-tetrahydrodipicolinate reductase
MGKLIAEACKNDEILGVVHPGLFTSPLDVPGRADVLIDFSYPGNLDDVLEYADRTGCALLIGTTGYSEAQIARIHRAAQKCPVMYASNYSLGVAVLKKALRIAAPLLKDRFDIEIVEEHHRKKADAPSGTALSLLSAIDPDGEYRPVFGRSGQDLSRGKEIGVSAVRGGTATGTHKVMFMGEDEFLTFEHAATSRRIFANGAMHALSFIADQKPGLYTFDDSIDL